MSSSLPKLFLAALAAAASCLAQAQTPRAVTTPKQAFGFNLGDDYMEANYTQATAYLQTLAKESDRMKLVDIGLTAEGRHQYMVIISSPGNMAKLDHYKDISAKLSHAEITSDEAHKLAQEGKAIVWIDGGLHASETVGAQQLVETIYQLNSLTDPETMRFLNDDIVLCVFANPDGMELVSNWYMRNTDPLKRTTDSTPRLWQKYVGHDNNRDFYINNMPESTNMSRVLFREWYPQLMYNHHQTGPLGTVIFIPPFRDPFNFNYDPLIPLKIEAVGTAMHERLVEEAKPGSGMRSEAPYSTWYNGGLRTVTYFHNMTGILTEIIGSPIPTPVAFLPSKQLPTGDLPFPVPPQMWHYRQSIDYEQTNNRAMLDYASREREHLLYDTWLMGHNSIERGSQDTWTITPKRIEALEEAAAKDAPARAEGSRTRADSRAPSNASSAMGGSATTPAPAPTPDEGERRQGVSSDLYAKVLHDPAKVDPRGYILTADQPDFPTAVKFVNALMKSGVTIDQASAPFTVEGKQYPAGSLVILTAQAYRPMILDMMEPQDHPNDFAYPGAPPTRPYDTTGWTLAFQMGVHFDRILKPFTGPFAPIATEFATVPPGMISETYKPVGYVISHEYNDAYTLTNRLLKASVPVYWLKQPYQVSDHQVAAGALWIPYSQKAAQVVEAAVKSLGINAYLDGRRPAGELIRIHTPRIALYDQYGGIMPSGWIRWLLEQFEFPFTVVYPQTLDAGNLNASFDDILFSTDAIPDLTPGAPTRGYGGQPKPESIPAEFRPWLGRITADKTLPQLKQFVQNGGTILAIGSSTRLYQAMDLPIRNAVTEVVKGKETPVPPERFYIPGSLLRAQIDNTQPLAYGMPSSVDVFFDSSPAFRVDPGAKGIIQTVAWYGSGNLLDSGWAWGQAYLNDSVAVAQANVGKGKLLLYGPEVTFRGQPHATFKLLFNGLLYGPATAETLK